MKIRFHLVVTVCVLVLAAASSGQAPRTNRKPAPKPAVRVTETSASNASAFTAAAERNAALRNELSWTFGGKQQRGWCLYDLLIGKTLDTHDNAVTSDFAKELAAWQKKRGLAANGVLDQNSLMALVSQWQSARLKTERPLSRINL